MIEGLPYGKTGLRIELRRQARAFSARDEWAWYVRRKGVTIHTGVAGSRDMAALQAAQAASRLEWSHD